MVDVKVEVRGLRELATAFKHVDVGLGKHLKAKFLIIAQRIVGYAQGRMPHVSGKAAASLKAKASDRGAGIAFGGTAAEYVPWLNFGGAVGRGKLVTRSIVEPDRYIYATIIKHKDETESAVNDAIAGTAKDAGFETKGGS